MPPVQQIVITAIDFEGTGVVQGYPDEPWQIGLVSLRAGRVVPESAFESLLRVGDRPFNCYAPGRHAELREAMRCAPPLPQLWAALGKRIEGTMPVAHNAATETRYLVNAFPLHAPRAWLDTLRLARIAYPRLPSYKLDDLLDRLALTPRVQALAPARGPHDALYDACGCAVLLEHLLSLPGWRNAAVEDLLCART